MEEGKKVLGIFLIVLFLIVVLGVVISRTAKTKKNVPLSGGSLESILFPDRPTPVPSIVVAEKSAKTGGLAKDIAKGSAGTTTGNTSGASTTTNTGSTTTTTTTQGQNGQTAPVVLGNSTTSRTTSNGTTSGSTSSKGGAENIPATGTPTIVIQLAMAGLASGVYLKRKAS